MHENPPDREPNTIRFKDMAEHSGNTRQGHRGEEGTAMREPPWYNRDLGSVRGQKRGWRKMRDMAQRQARGAGRRDDKQRLAGGGCG